MYCRDWLQTVVRIFASYEDFRSSPYYGGAGDFLINDHNATRAVWPGKTNAERSVEDWWICTPVHPFCSCHWTAFSPEGEGGVDWLDGFREESSRIARENAEAFVEDRDALHAERYKSDTGQALLSGVFRPVDPGAPPPAPYGRYIVKGLFHARTCACEHEDDPVAQGSSRPSWTREYLRRWPVHGNPEADR